MGRASRTDGPVIDIHCHRDSEPAAAMMREAAQAAGKVALGHGDVLTRQVNERQLAEIAPKMADLEVRIADMDRMGVDVQVLAPAAYQYFYWAPPELGARACRTINEDMAAAAAVHPERFLPFGAVPLQDVDATLQELTYLSSELGMRGIEIGTHVEGEEISARRLEPFWGMVEELGTVVIIHTQGTTHPERLQGHNFVNLLGHPFEATLAQAHLIFTGVMERHPGLKIVVVHGGGYLPAYAGRTDHAWQAREDVRAGVEHPPGTYLRRFYFDTMVFEPSQLAYLLAQYGAEHVLLGTDYPYDMGDDDPLALVGASGLGQPDIDLVAGGNAARLLGLT